MKKCFPALVAAAYIAPLVIALPLHAAEITRDFESNSLTGFRISGNAPSVQGQVKRAGRYGMKTVLDRYSSPVPYRTEVRLLAPETLKQQDYWYGFGVYLPTDYVPDYVAWEIVAQWHHNPDSGDTMGNPPLALNSSNGQWRIENRWSSARLTTKSNSGGRAFNLGAYKTGVWTDWVFRIKWSYQSDGLIEVWKNGTKVLRATGPNCYNDERMPYFKMGLYKNWYDGKAVGPVKRRTLYHDQLRAVGPGGSYSSVAPSSTLSSPSQLTIQ